MEKITGNEPAMPIIKTVGDGTGTIGSVIEPGLTIRQHFAAISLQGMLSNPELYKITSEYMKPEYISEFYCKCSVEQADLLIAELNKS